MTAKIRSNRAIAEFTSLKEEVERAAKGGTDGERRELRGLLTEFLSEQREYIKEAMGRSPIVAMVKAPKAAHVPAFTPAGLASVMGTQAIKDTLAVTLMMKTPLWAGGSGRKAHSDFISGKCEDKAFEQGLSNGAAHLINQAIKEPGAFGVESTNPRSKTGYVIGLHSRANGAYKVMSNLNTYITVTDYLIHSAGIERNEENINNTIDAMGMAFGWDETFKAVISSVFENRLKESVVSEESDFTEEVKNLAAKVATSGASVSGDEDEFAEEAEEGSEKTTTPTKPKEEAPTLKFEDPSLGVAFDVMLDKASGGKIGKLDMLQDMINDLFAKKNRVEELEDLTVKLKAKASGPAMPKSIDASGEIPEGKLVSIKAYEALGRRKSKALDFDVTKFEWSGDHPLVPEVDDDYIIRPELAVSILYSLANNEPMWLAGHTGTGKTTLLEQIAARLNWPVSRINFDSEITRMDLIGRDTLISDGEGNTVSKFEKGALPSAMEMPVILICDEVDRIRAEVSYVFQRTLEGNGLVLNEDGAKLIHQHPMFRIAATANTVGQGDELGLYQGARQQSSAFLNRFTSWIQVDYLKESEERELLKSSEPGIKDESLDMVMRYVREHRDAFMQAEILHPISPRSLKELVKKIAWYSARFTDRKAVGMAFHNTLFDGASLSDRGVMMGLFDRIIKKS